MTALAQELLRWEQRGVGGSVPFVHPRFIITSPSRLSVSPLGHRQCLILKKKLILNQKVNFE